MKKIKANSLFKPIKLTIKKNVKPGPLFKPVKLATKKNIRFINKKNLTWPQARVRYPKLKMFGDADKDGKLNMFDCKPFNKKKHGMTHQYGFSSTAYKRIKTVKMKPRTFLKETYKEVQAGTTPEGDLKMGLMTFKGAGAPAKFETYVEQIRKTPSHKGETEKTAVVAIKKKILSKKKNVPIPFLNYSDGNPTGHEGRHTALAIEELGIKTMPVTVEAKLEEEIPETYNLPEHRKQIPLDPHNYNYEKERYEPSKDHVHNAKTEAAKYSEEGISPELIDSIEINDTPEVDDTPDMDSVEINDTPEEDEPEAVDIDKGEEDATASKV